MKKIILLILYALLPAFISAQNKKLTRQIKRVTPAIVKITIEGNDGYIHNGTGFLIDSKGTCVTNFHVLDNAGKITVTDYKGKKYKTDTILSSSRKADLAVIVLSRPDSGKFHALKFAKRKPRAGQFVFSIGHPDGYDYSAGSGIVSGVRKENGVKYIQTTVPCSEGSSGSPLLNSRGKVLGIIYRIKYAGQNINLAIDAEEFFQLKDDHLLREEYYFEHKSYGNIDSAFARAEQLIQKKEYERTIKILLPFTRFSDMLPEKQKLALYTLLADSYMNTEDYMMAYHHYSLFINHFSGKAPDKVDEYYRAKYFQNTFSAALCLHLRGITEQAIVTLESTLPFLLQMAAEAADEKTEEIYNHTTDLYYTGLTVFYLQRKKTEKACFYWHLHKTLNIHDEDEKMNGLDIQKDEICKPYEKIIKIDLLGK